MRRLTLWFLIFMISATWSRADVPLSPSSFSVSAVDVNGVNRSVSVSNVRYYWTGSAYRLLFSYGINGGPFSPVNVRVEYTGSGPAVAYDHQATGGSPNRLLGPGPCTVTMTLILGTHTRTETWSFDASGNEEDDPQTITVSPTTAEIPLNQLVTLTASGGQNAYAWSATGNAAIVNDGGPTAQIGWDAKGTYTVSVYNEAGAGYQQSNTATATVTVVDPLLPQMVTVTPSSGSMIVGETFALTASGAEGGNPYNWSLDEPEGGAGGLASQAANAIFTPSKKGTYIIKVWASEGNGYERSDDATATITVTESGDSGHSATITFDNRSRDYPVRFNVYQDGRVVHTVLVPGGTRLVQKVSLPTDSPYTVTAILKDPRLNPDGTWSDGEEEEVIVAQGTPDDNGDPVTAEPEVPADGTPPEEELPENDPNYVSDQDKAQIKAALDKAQEAGRQMQSEANKVVQRFGRGPSASPVVPEAVPAGAIDLGVHGGKHLYILKNPFSDQGPFNGVMGRVAGLIKRLIAWGVVVMFVLWLQGRIRAMILSPFSVAPFGNTLANSANSVRIFGNGGGWGAALQVLLLAGLLIILLSMPVICMAAVTSGLPWSDLTSIASAGAGLSEAAASSGMLGQAISLAGEVIPWQVLLAAPAWYFIVNNLIFPSQLFWTVFIKFIP